MLTRALLGQIFAPGNRLHADAGPDPGDPGAEIAEPKNSQRLAVEIEAERFLPSSARAHGVELLPQVACERQHQGNGQLGRGEASAAGAAYGYAVRLGGLEIDRGVALAGGHQQLEDR